MAWDKKYLAQEKYAARQRETWDAVYVRLRKDKDADILVALGDQNRAARVRALVRLGIQAERGLLK